MWMLNFCQAYIWPLNEETCISSCLKIPWLYGIGAKACDNRSFWKSCQSTSNFVWLI